MHIFLAGLGCEVNSFVEARCTIEDFRRMGLFRPGIDPHRHLYAFAHEVWMREAEADGHRVTGGLLAFAPPHGALTSDCYATIADGIVGDLERAGPVDLILLNLHGATLEETGLHCEVDLVRRVRSLAPTAVIGLQLDLHAHLAPSLLVDANLIVTHKRYPHTDTGERALELYRLGVAAAEERIRPRMAMHDLRMLGVFPTVREPMASYVERLQQVERSGALLSASLVHGFPWGDTPYTGTRMLAIADGDAPQAQAMAGRLADEFRAIRDEADLRFLEPDAAIDAALAVESHRPVVLADACDNPGGGAPGDATFLLQHMIDRALPSAAMGLLHDPAATERAFELGVGATFEFGVGGKCEATSGTPVQARWTVTGLCDAAFQYHDAEGKDAIPMGRIAALKTGGVTVVVGVQRPQTLSPEFFAQAGLDWQSTRILAVKSTVHFHARFAPRASQILFVRTPAALQLDYRQLPYKRLPRPIWPLDVQS